MLDLKHKLLYVLLPLVIIVAGACNSTDQSATENYQVSEGDIRAFIEELSSDAYEGRKPFSPGEQKTIEYIRSEMERAGLKPGNGDSYFQAVPLIEIIPKPAPHMRISGPSTELTWNLRDDYVGYTVREQKEVSIDDSPLVFCGFGVVAPEYDWNDYAGIDMAGKTAVVLVNDPGFGTGGDAFKGDTMTYYGRWSYKYEEAERQGAEGVLIIHETTSAGYGWYVVENGWTGGQQQLQSKGGNMSKPAFQGWITLDKAKELFGAAGLDLGQQIRSARTQGFTPVEMGLSMSTSLTNTFKTDVSQNVVAMLEGASRPEETIIYSAHWDHLGIGAAVDGDSIFNGAVDNATGTAAVMAIAKAFASMPEPPERSLVFLFVTAEEQGLLGSKWYAKHPIFPLDKTVANINMDALYPFGEFNDLSIRGYGQSDMDNYAREAAAKQDRYVLPDTEPHKGYFFRSDHFSFAKVGVPALYAKTGIDHRTEGKEYGKQVEEQYRLDAYHQPADEYDADTWDMGGIMQDAQLFFDIGLRLANESTYPQWKPGSEFRGEKPRGTDGE